MAASEKARQTNLEIGEATRLAVPGRQHSVRFLSRASLIAALRPSEQEYRQRIANGRFPNLGVGGERQLPIFTTDRLGHSADLDLSQDRPLKYA